MHPVSYYQSIDSTNRKAKELAGEGAPSGTAVVAEFQTAGRGRLGKEWCSVPGKGLYCSIIVRPELEITDYPKITLVAGLAVAELLDKLTGKVSELKWPNDVYFTGRKIAGILTESSSLTIGKDERYAVVGIGLNVNQQNIDFPLELQQTVTSMTLETGQLFEVKEIFQGLHLALLDQLQTFEEVGFAPLLARWRQKDFLCGKEMECVSSEGFRVKGTAQGVDEEGYLYVKDSQGLLHEVLSGDVSLAR